MTLSRRQALINLLLVLLFAVACMNFFIDVDSGGSGDGITSMIALPAERSFQKSSPFNFNTKSTADVVTIKAGHLNGKLCLPDALRPSKYQLHTDIIKSDEDNPQCCLIASAPNKPKRITIHVTAPASYLAPAMINYIHFNLLLRNHSLINCET